MRPLIFILTIMLISCRSTNEQTDDIPPNSISELKTINPDTNYSDDLTFLDKLVADKKIVLLGECGHEFGSDFLLKTRIIKYLSDKHAFKTVALEGGSFYTMNNPDKPINKDSSFVANFATMSTMAVWGYSNEFRPLAEYIKNSSTKFIGLENQLSIPGNYPFLYDFKNYLVSNKIPFDTTTFNVFEWAYINILSQQVSEKQKIVGKIGQLSQWLKEIKNSLATKKPTAYEFYSMVVDNVIDQLDFYLVMDENNFDAIAKGNNIRDNRMFLNLQWFLNKNPNEKVIVWAASLHCCKDLALITHDKSPNVYKNTTVLGEHIFNKYGNQSASYAITSGQGNVAFCTDTATTALKKPTANIPLEFQLSKTKMIAAFVDFTNIENKDKQFKSEFFGHGNNGSWYKAFDGVFYVATARPATLIKMQ